MIFYLRIPVFLSRPAHFMIAVIQTQTLLAKRMSTCGVNMILLCWDLYEFLSTSTLREDSLDAVLWWCIKPHIYCGIDHVSIDTWSSKYVFVRVTWSSLKQSPPPSKETFQTLLYPARPYISICMLPTTLVVGLKRNESCEYVKSVLTLVYLMCWYKPSLDKLQ